MSPPSSASRSSHAAKPAWRLSAFGSGQAGVRDLAGERMLDRVLALAGDRRCRSADG